MIQKMTLLFLLGLVSETSCYFILIQEPKTWTEAQSFCREYHLDLATVQTDQDRSEMQEITSSVSFDRGWVGLYGGLCEWRWSYQDQDLVFSNWGLSEDTTTKTQRKCGVIRNTTGTWHTASCDEQKPFFCYKLGGNKFIFFKIKMTWRDAQRYCRMIHIDLAIISSLSDNTNITSLLVAYHGSEGWIGLSMNLWLWSDQSTVSWLSLKWSSGEPNNGVGNERCVFTRRTGLIGDDTCLYRLPFLCTERSQSQMQLVRVAVRSAGPLDESAVKTAVEDKIWQILSEQNMDAGSRVTWRVQANGKIFQPQRNNTPNTTTVCEKRDNRRP